MTSACCSKKQNNKPNFWADKPLWKRAGVNTSVCLLGCSIGDIGALMYFAFHMAHVDMWVQMVTAIVAGISTSIMLETLLLRKKEGLSWLASFKLAAGMSLISMIAMELAMNATDFYLRGSYNLTTADLGFYLALIPSLILGYLTPLPYNYWRLKALGKGCCA